MNDSLREFVEGMIGKWSASEADYYVVAREYFPNTEDSEIKREIKTCIANLKEQK